MRYVRGLDGRSPRQELSGKSESVFGARLRENASAAIPRIHQQILQCCKGGAVSCGDLSVTTLNCPRRCQKPSVTTLKCPRRCQTKGSEDTLGGDVPTKKEIQEANAVVALYPIQRVLIEGRVNSSAVTMFDTGANVHLILNDFAERNGWVGRPVTQTIVTAGGARTVHTTKQYWVPLKKKDGTIVKILCLGMDQITDEMDLVDVSAAAEMFGVSVQELYRPTGSVDILIGIHEAALFPTFKEERGNLRLMSSQFGSGLVLEGSHPRIDAGGLRINPEALHFTRTVKGAAGAKPRGKVKSPKVANVNFVHSESVMHAGKAQFSFLENEELGVGQPARCGTCKNCTRCSVRAQQMTAKEQSELALVEECIKFNEEEKKVVFSYPYIKDVSRLQDNYQQAVAIESGVEKRLLKMGKRAEYDKEMLGYIGRGAFKKLTQEEIDSWKKKGGPVNYISHHGVLKETSATTKLRIVSNSSLNNNNQGFSLNDCLPKGPNSLVPLLEALVTWRIYPHVTVWDYIKCYNSIHTSEKDMHLRRFVWRLDGENKWQIYAIDRMHFGDRCAAIGLDVAKKMVAEAGRHIDSKAVDMVKRDYVDDGFGGGTEDDVRRIMGEVTVKNPEGEDEIQFRGTVPAIMQKAGS